MENWGYVALGEMLCGLGNALKDPNSDVRKDFRLSREQFATLLGMIRLAAAPSVQKKYMHDLADRWGVSERTIRNWIEYGLVREGHKTSHDTRHWWTADEIDEDERTLIRYGYVKPKKHHRIGYFIRMLNGFIK